VLAFYRRKLNEVPTAQNAAPTLMQAILSPNQSGWGGGVEAAASVLKFGSFDRTLALAA
jgi:hypothetical protein